MVVASRMRVPIGKQRTSENFNLKNSIIADAKKKKIKEAKISLCQGQSIFQNEDTDQQAEKS
jgi:hypothetical protein